MIPIGESGLEIMDVLWKAKEPVDARFISENLKSRSHLALSSVMATLARLCQRGFVKCDREGRRNMYSAVISEKEYKGRERSGLIKQLYGNSLQSMVAGLLNAGEIKKEDAAELKKVLDRFKEE
jgi:BlaI family penicillinase repressor